MEKSTQTLSDLMEVRTTRPSDPMLMPNCKPLPKRICKQCGNYREGGICTVALHGVTSPLQDADDKRCFREKEQKAEVQHRPTISEKRKETPVEQPKKVETTVVPPEPERRDTGETTAPQTEKRERKKCGPKLKPMPTHKICIHCGRNLPLAAFDKSKNKDKRDGHYDQCRDCRSAMYESRRRYATEEERKEAQRRINRTCYQRKMERVRKERGLSDADTERRCKVCGEVKPIDQYRLIRGGRRLCTCNDCYAAAQRAGFEKHIAERVGKVERKVYDILIGLGISESDAVRAAKEIRKIFKKD